MCTHFPTLARLKKECILCQSYALLVMSQISTKKSELGQIVLTLCPERGRDEQIKGR